MPELWTKQRQGPDESRYIIGPENGADTGRFIARMDNTATDADWSLIEAAPELLAVLTEIISQIDQGGSGGKVFARDSCIARARAGIAKATATKQEAAKTTSAPDYEDTAAGFQNERTLELAGITPQRRTE